MGVDQDQDQVQVQNKRREIENSKGFNGLPNKRPSRPICYDVLKYSDESIREYTWLDGHDLLEVFRVRINRPGLISGKVIAQVAFYDHQLYNNDDGQFITSEDDCLLLTDPPRITSMVAYDYALIHLILDWKSLISSEEDKISDRAVFIEGSDGHYKPMRYTLTSVNGLVTATVFYSVFEIGVKATFEVTLIDEQNPVVGVYGVVAASNDMISAAAVKAGVDDADYESVLFLKGWDESVELSHQQSIQMSRSAVAVPLNSNLIVRAILHNKKDPGNSFIPPTKLYFPAKPSGISVLLILDKIEVKVTWSTEFDRPPEDQWYGPCIDWRCSCTHHKPRQDLRPVTH